MFSTILPGSSETFERASPGPISWSNSFRFTKYIIPHDLEYKNNLEDHLVHTYHKKKVIHLVYHPILPVRYLNEPESRVLCKEFTLKILNTVDSTLFFYVSQGELNRRRGGWVSVHFAVTFLDCWRTSFCVTTIKKIVNNNTNDKQTSGASLALDEDSPYANSCLFTLNQLPLLLLRKN